MEIRACNVRQHAKIMALQEKQRFKIAILKGQIVSAKLVQNRRLLVGPVQMDVRTSVILGHI